MLLLKRNPQTEKGIQRRYEESWQRTSSNQGINLNTGNVASDEFSEHPSTRTSALIRTTAIGIERLKQRDKMRNNASCASLSCNIPASSEKDRIKPDLLGL